MRRGRQVLVTGGTGFIGSALIARLVAEGDDVTVLMRAGSNRMRLQGLEGKLDSCAGDLRDERAVVAAVQHAKPEVVFHLASTIWTQDPAVTVAVHMETNLLGTLHLLEALRVVPGARVVFTGSSSVYGPGSQLQERSRLAPNTLYGATKAATSVLIQTYARRYQMHTVELRLFMPYGPWEQPNRLIPHTILSALAGEDIPLTEGLQQRDVVYMDDVIEALVLAAKQPLEPGAVFNIGSGVGVTVREIVERIVGLMGHPVKPLIGALPMRPDEMMEMSADITAAKAHLGWEPRVSLEEGLRRTIAWWTEHHAAISRQPSAVSTTQR